MEITNNKALAFLKNFITPLKELDNKEDLKKLLNVSSTQLRLLSTSYQSIFDIIPLSTGNWGSKRPRLLISNILPLIELSLSERSEHTESEKIERKIERRRFLDQFILDFANLQFEIAQVFHL